MMVIAWESASQSSAELFWRDKGGRSQYQRDSDEKNTCNQAHFLAEVCLVFSASHKEKMSPWMILELS